MHDHAVSRLVDSTHCKEVRKFELLFNELEVVRSKGLANSVPDDICGLPIRLKMRLTSTTLEF